MGMGNESLFAAFESHDQEPQWVRGTKVCAPHLVHLTKIAATFIHDKTLLKSSSPEPKGQWPQDLVCSTGDGGQIKV